MSFGGFGQSAGGLGASPFGAKPAAGGGGGLFGGQQAQSGGSLFGGGAPAGGASMGGGLFGQSQPASQGSLFGASSAPSLFGSTQQPAQSAGSLFGSGFGSSSSGIGSSGFGSGLSQPAAGASAPSLFGGGASSGPGLFGASTGSSLFGGQQSQSTSLFGNTSSSLFGANTAPAGGSLFGGGAGAGGGTQANRSLLGGGGGLGFGAGAGTALGQPAAAPQLPHGLQSVFDAFDPNGPYCRFRHMLYSMVDPQDVERYQRPAGTDERLWEQARENNPDPSRLVPVQASSFEQLYARVEHQNARLAAHLAVLSNIERSVAELQKDHNLSSAVKLADYRRRHNELVQKLFALTCKLERAMCRGQHLTEDEVALRHGLEAVARQLSKPVQLSDKLADLDKAVKYAVDQKRRVEASHAELETNMVRELKGLLTEQYRGIAHLFSEHRTSVQNLEILRNMLSESVSN